MKAGDKKSLFNHLHIDVALTADPVDDRAMEILASINSSAMHNLVLGRLLSSHVGQHSEEETWIPWSKHMLIFASTFEY